MNQINNKLPKSNLTKLTNQAIDKNLTPPEKLLSQFIGQVNNNLAGLTNNSVPGYTLALPLGNPTINPNILNIVVEIAQLFNTAVLLQSQTQSQMVKISSAISAEFSQESLHLAQALQEGIAKLQAELKTQQEEANEYQGFFGLLFGTAEFIGGLVSFVISGGDDAAALVSAINGLTKMVAACVDICEAACGETPNAEVLDFMQNGIFAIADAGDGWTGEYASKAQDAFYVATIALSIGSALADVLSESSTTAIKAGTSTLRQVGAVAMKTVVLVNEISTLVGTLYMLFANNQQSDSSGIGWAQALSMGLGAMLLSEVLKLAGAERAIEDKLGPIWGKVLENGILMGTSIVASFAMAHFSNKTSVVDENFIKTSGDYIAKLKRSMIKLQKIQPALNFYMALDQLDQAANNLGNALVKRPQEQESAKQKLLNQENQIAVTINNVLLNNQEQIHNNLLKQMSLLGRELQQFLQQALSVIQAADFKIS